MTDKATDPIGPEDDALAAEFVLGVLDSADHAACAIRTATDPAFAERVAAWEARFSGMNDAFEPVAPPEAVKAALDRRLFGEARSEAPAPRRRLSFLPWAVAAVAIVVAVALAAMNFLQPVAPTPPGQQLIASLEPNESDNRFVAVYDTATDRLSVVPVSGEKPADTDFELWLIVGEAAPVSLGVIGGAETGPLVVADALRGGVTEGSLLAVSIEPPGGSSTGSPTGPVVSLGAIQKI